MAESILAGVAKWRVSDVVGQTGRRHDVSEIRCLKPRQSVASDRLLPHERAERTADTGGFQAVGESGAHIVDPRKREDLGLVLHATKGGAEYDAVHIPLKIGAQG